MDGSPKDLKSKSFANIQELFNKAIKRVNTFVDYKTELVEGSSEKSEVEIAQKSKLDVDANFLYDTKRASKKPGQQIKTWKIHKEGKKSYYQIIRDDGSSKMYY
ncbi:hypothetical protein Tco_1186096 [Tanacetum coccineum]